MQLHAVAVWVEQLALFPPVILPSSLLRRSLSFLVMVLGLFWKYSTYPPHIGKQLETEQKCLGGHVLLDHAHIIQTWHAYTCIGCTTNDTYITYKCTHISAKLCHSIPLVCGSFTLTPIKTLAVWHTEYIYLKSKPCQTSFLLDLLSVAHCKTNL